MGVDVNLYAVGSVDDAELAAAEAYIRARLGGPDEFYDSWLARATWDAGRVQFQCFDRVYAQGYERGDWPRIYGYIMALRGALPGCVLHYGGDSDEDAPEVTGASLDAMWAHWLGPDGNAYRERRGAEQLVPRREA